MSEVVEHLDLRTGRFHQLRLLIITRTAPHASYRERFSPLAPSGGEHLLRYVRCCKKQTRGLVASLLKSTIVYSFILNFDIQPFTKGILLSKSA